MKMRRDIAVFAASAILLAIVCSWLFAIGSNAAELHKPDGRKVYTSVTISRSMNVDKIIEDYCDYEYYRNEQEFVKEICSINGLTYYYGKELKLHSGDCLIVPHYVDEKQL